MQPLLILDMVWQDKKSALFGFGFALVRFFLTIPSTLPLGMVMCILCPCMTEVCKLQGAAGKRQRCISEGTLDI